MSFDALPRTKPSVLLQSCVATCSLVGLLASAATLAAEPQAPAQQLLLQQQRERAQREQLEPSPDVRLETPQDSSGTLRLPRNETPCFKIDRVVLGGDQSEDFQWALRAANPSDDPVQGQCVGSAGINLTMKRIQNAIIAKGFITTRVLAQPQDLNQGTLALVLVPGRIKHIRFAQGTSTRANYWNAMPASPGDVLNLRDIEQALENFKRVPTAEADVQITPAEGADAQPGESDVVIAWKQAIPVRVSLSVDDSGSKQTGKYQGNVALSLDNLATLNDLFYISFNHDLGGGQSGDRGSKGHTVHYSVPYDYWQLSLTSSEYDYHQTIAGVNQAYSYSGRSRTNEVQLSRVIYRDAVRKTTVSVGGWSRTSSNYIEDTEIELQRRRMAGWQAGINHREFIGANTLDLGVGYRRGTGARDALRAPEEENGEGTSRSQIITANAQLQVPFTLSDQRLRYVAGWRGQWNRTPLIPQDRFSIGGRYTVRGFDGEQILSAERGWTFSNDLGLSLANTGQELYLGVDYGEVGGHSTQYLSGRRLAGAVVGLRGGYKQFSYDIYTGKPLEKPKGFQTADVTSGFSANWSF
ncbi:ShlB/FhaC/HecB family hemolysin secretion/activation protein [Pseudomonas extremorientalis]|jgi:hemolysin activation/secretion protein|uniref:ShlB/FhaC/HecB family hemolysin secretion/activation protein n=1 Tax=Pseudomonas extremorientalis TaxID=169669 RepID=UPI00211B9356|nr:ShlB/FhaC/HecB family hemolysin secretion/activation protein [Pseudomonas extremorientalis]UUN87198.1 ShlB/FhaC/HecB family hemolysin secretion/activation protein [Pseudomonas extremorientalis]